MRSIVPGERAAANVANESLLRRWILVVRLASDEFIRYATREAIRSNGLRVSTCHQMHFPQIRCVRFDSKARLTVYSSTEYCQRKNVHFHLVLVHHTNVAVAWIAGLSVSTRSLLSHPFDSTHFRLLINCIPFLAISPLSSEFTSFAAFWSSQWLAWDRPFWTPEIAWCHVTLPIKYQSSWILAIGGSCTCSAGIWTQLYSKTYWNSSLNDSNCDRTVKIRTNKDTKSKTRCAGCPWRHQRKRIHENTCRFARATNYGL